MTTTRRGALAQLGGALAAFSFGADVFASTPLELNAAPVVLDEHDAGVERVGPLRWRGGLWLGSPDKRFGGWSDLWIAADRSRLIAISDRGWTLDAAPVFDANLRGLQGARFGRLIEPDGKAVLRAASDAEGLARLPDGSFAVSFEQTHRILVYPPAEPPFSKPPRARTAPNLADTPRNGGMEALIALPSGALVTLIEDGPENGLHRGFVETATGWAKFGYRAGENFAPVGICALANGDFVVLERSFSIFFGGFGARLVRIAANAFVPGAIVEGQEIARLRPPMLADNYEGIAATLAPDGTQLLWLLSDDNFMSLQRTLLVVFAL